MRNLSYWDELKYSRNWKSIIIGISICLFLLISLTIAFNKIYIEMKLSENNKSGITTGFIVNRAEHTDFRQTIANGNHSYMDKIYFYYTYTVAGKIYYGNEPLSYSIVIAQELNKARKGTLPYPVTIKYDISNHNQSIIWFK